MKIFACDAVLLVIPNDKHDNVIKGDNAHFILMIKAWLHFAIVDEAMMWRIVWNLLKLTFHGG
jgi:hypothetical protein